MTLECLPLSRAKPEKMACLSSPLLAGSPPQPPWYGLGLWLPVRGLDCRLNAMSSLQARGLRDIADVSVPRSFPLHRIKAGSKGALV